MVDLCHPPHASPLRIARRCRRGIACLLVVLFHASLYFSDRKTSTPARAVRRWFIFDWVIVATGRFWIGVPLFFVVSGYCIAAKSLTRFGTSPAGPASYFTRCMRRIYPPPVLGGHRGQATVHQGFRPCQIPPFRRTVEGQTPFRSPSERSVLAVARAPHAHRIVAPGGRRSGTQLRDGPTWTLCYEEQFYLIVGVVLLVLAAVVLHRCVCRHRDLSCSTPLDTNPYPL